jgi:hypothetical protein
MHFIQTCCQILKSNEKGRIRLIGISTLWDGKGKVQATISAIRKHLEAHGNEAENHRRDLLALHQTTHNVDNLVALARSLQHLEDSARGSGEAIPRGFAMGIRITKLDLEKSLEDFRTTLGRIAMAAKWKKEAISAWDKKGKDACSNLIK